MTENDLLNGLDDAAKICEVNIPSSYATSLFNPAESFPATTTFDLRRAVEAVRLAKKLLENSGLAEKHFENQKYHALDFERKQFQKWCQERRDTKPCSTTT